MKSISEPFINRPVMTMLVYLAIAAFGVYSYLAMPVSDLPTVDYPIIKVSVSYPGASPEVMAHNVASPLEQQFLQIPGIELVASNNSLGNSQITLQFSLDKSIDAVASDVQSAIAAAAGSLPQDLPSPPTYQKVNPNDLPVIFFGMISYTMTEAQLYDYAAVNVAQRIQTVSGVASVGVYGSPRAVRIEVDPRKLYSRGLTFTDINAAIKANTTLQSAGQIMGATIQYTVKPQTQLETAADYSKLIVAYKDGAPVYLHDVADVVDSVQSEYMKMAYMARGLPPGSVGIVLAVSKTSGANNVEVAKGVLKLLPIIQASMPQSIRLIPIYNRATNIANSVADVTVTLLIAFVLVVLVVFLFLGRARDTLIPALALPMSLLITFIIMHLCGYSLDNLSLMALTLSVGFLIDDAIVFLENMVRRMEAGEKVWTAVFEGAREISFTILAMTLSLGSVFIPLVGMGGMMGRVFREFGVTIIVAVISSGIVSLTLTPMMCSRILKEYNKETRSWLERTAHTIEDNFLKIYSPTLTFALKHWYFSVLAYCACFFGVIWFYNQVPKSFLPVGDSGFIFGAWLTKTDTSPTQMQKMQDGLIQAISKNPYVAGFVTVSGFSSRTNSNMGLTFIALDDPKTGRPSIQDVSNDISKNMAQVPGVIPAIRPRASLQISAGVVSTTTGGYSYIMSGLDKDEVYSSAMAMVAAMRQRTDIFARVNSDYYADNRQIELNVNRDQASTYGVNATTMAQNIANAYSQNYSYLIKSDYLQYWVVVEAAPQFRAQVKNLTDVYFDSQVNTNPLFAQDASQSINDLNSSRMVPFHSVATPKVSVGPLAINHFNGFTSVTISFDINSNVTIGAATDFIDQTAKKLVPPSVSGGFQGDALVFKQTVVQMGLMFCVALFVMYIILGILYESYIHPITVLLSIPPAIVGGFATLYVANLLKPGSGYGELSLYGMIGMFMLAGIVKKNAIMMIDFAIIRQAEGRTPLDAVHEACLERFRPILMTTLAAFFGSLPIAMGYGTDSASRIPLGLAICGGLVVSQVITLFVTPVTYLGFEWVQVHVLDRLPFFARRHKETPAAPPPTPPSQPQHA
jgi:HAE1 family hydrophobic/amphiphilic exporter-1